MNPNLVQFDFNGRTFTYAVTDNGYKTPCWIFQNPRRQAPNGWYVRIQFNGERPALHRLVYERAFGPIPDGLEIDHLCRQTRCIRLDHLEAVTHTENIRRYHRADPKRLTAEEVEEILAAPRGYGTGWVLAEKYGVSQALISQIRHGKIYRGL